MHILIIQHVDFENPGAILRWAENSGHSIQIAHPYAEEPLPTLDQFDALILLGGPMSVHDAPTLPWLVAEKQLVAECLEVKKKIVGICFGAQILAEALGARVYAMEEKEIGWHAVFRTMSHGSHRLLDAIPEYQSIFHWHGETFDLPGGALLLAGSNCCSNQVFTYGQWALGIQFHPEMTPEIAKALCENCPEDLAEAPYVQSEEEMFSDLERFEKGNEVLFRLLDGFLAE